MNPEERARKNIDRRLEECVWRVENFDEMNVYAPKGVAVREFSMPGAGEADYLLYADGKAIGVVEAKPEDWTLKGVEVQSNLRTSSPFTLKKHPLRRHHLDEFVRLHSPSNRHEREATWSEENPDDRWRRYPYEEIARRDGANLDPSWIRDKSLEDFADLEAPDAIAKELADDLEAALEQVAAIAFDLKEREGA